MDGDGRHPELGGEANASDDNVVRLPREWLGPREELVPVAVDEEPDDTLATPPSTHDFWGNALSEDWTAPVEEASTATRERRHRRRSVAHGRTSAARRYVRRSSWIGFPGRAPGPAGAAPRRLRPPAGLAGAVILMLVGIVISVGGQAGHSARIARATPAVAAQSTAIAAGTGLTPEVTTARLHSRPSAAGTRRSPHRTIATRRTNRSAHRRTARHPSPRSRTITVEQVRYTAPAATTTSSPSNPSPSRAAPPVTLPVALPATAATRTVSGSRQPATGSSGALGPGSSPDG